MFHVMDVLAESAARRSAGLPVYSLAAGQPSTPAPAAVRAAVADVLGSEILGYTESLGIMPLREAIAAHHRERDGVPVTADEVVVTTGSSGAFTLIFLAAFDVGATVAVARPGYPAYRNTLAALGARVVELDCGPATRFVPTVEMLDELDEPPAALIVASPANPTGTVLDAGDLAALSGWCDAHGTLLISDEIYHGISYGRPTVSARRFGDRSVVVNSTSKYFSMTGWRLGWMLVPPELRRPVERLTANMTICPPTLSQYGAVAAFSADAITELDGHVARYALNRRLLLDGLAELGITDIAPPDGAFYVYANVEHLTDDSIGWCAEVLASTGVAMAPGVDFDTDAGRHTVRMSFAGGSDTIGAALEQLAAVVR